MSQQDFIQTLFKNNQTGFSNIPDKKLAEELADKLFGFLFNTYPDKYDSEKKLLQEFNNLKNTFSALIFEMFPNEKEVEKLTEEFFRSIPDIYQQLLKDAQAIAHFDPAAQSIHEVLIAYPGFYATAIYRFSNQLYKQGVKTLPRLLSEHAHSQTGIDIHPGATIGESFFIDHGTGIVIGETTLIGKHVKIYQGVTIGALNSTREKAKSKRHPTIEDNVIIYSGATILGGDTVIGHDSIIGGNTWLTHGVAPFSVVYHKSEITARNGKTLSADLNFVI